MKTLDALVTARRAPVGQGALRASLGCSLAERQPRRRRAPAPRAARAPRGRARPARQAPHRHRRRPRRDRAHRRPAPARPRALRRVAHRRAARRASPPRSTASPHHLTRHSQDRTPHGLRTPDQHDDNRRWWTLGAMCFALFMIMLDNTVVNVALPSIQRDLDVSIVGPRVDGQRLHADLRRAARHRRAAGRHLRPPPLVPHRRRRSSARRALFIALLADRRRGSSPGAPSRASAPRS